jgi:hypothetical protein
MLSVVMLSVVMLSVVMLNDVAPFKLAYYVTNISDARKLLITLARCIMTLFLP